MKLIIAGGRDMRVSLNFIKSKLVFFEIPIETLTEIVEGDALGIDYCGRRFAQEMGIPYKTFPYKKELGKAGGPARNREMADYADALMLIWDGMSKGSANMKFEARKRELPIFETILSSPTQADRKKLGIYVAPKDRKSHVNKSNQPLPNPGATA